MLFVVYRYSSEVALDFPASKPLYIVCKSMVSQRCAFFLVLQRHPNFFGSFIAIKPVAMVMKLVPLVDLGLPCNVSNSPVNS
jgi:hypothetical protein